MMIGKKEDGMIYHYTSFPTFFEKILPYRRLRLAPFANSMDPRERLPLNLGFEVTSDESASEWEAWQGLTSELYDAVRRRAHMVCFSNSYQSAKQDFDSDGRRGWAQAAMWTHFAGRGSGICLEIDREELLNAIDGEASANGLVMHGDVLYPPAEGVPIWVPNMSVETLQNIKTPELLGHVYQNSLSSFFQKNSNWSYEQEFRVVIINNCGEPVYIPINNSLKKIIIGSESTPLQREALNWALEASGMDVQVQQMVWHGSMTFASTPVTAERNAGTRSDANPAFPAVPPEEEHVHSPDCLPVLALAKREIPEANWREPVYRYFLDEVGRGLAGLASIGRESYSRVDEFRLPVEGVDEYPLRGQRFSIWRSWVNLGVGIFIAIPAIGWNDSLQLEITVEGQIKCERRWKLKTSDSDQVLMRCLAEVTELVNQYVLAYVAEKYPS